LMARGRFRFINVAGLFRWVWPVFLKPELEARSKAGSKAAPPFVGERWGRWVAGARCKYVRVSSVAASMRLRAPATHRPQRFQNWLVRLDSRQRQEPERCTGFRWGRKSCRAWLGTTAACMRARGGRRLALALALAFALAFALPCEPRHCPRAGLCGLPGPCVAMDGNTEPPRMDLRRAPETHTGLPSPAQTRNRFGRGCCRCRCRRS